MEPRWTPMASLTQPSVEANVDTLMNVDNKELWREEGLFDKMESTVHGTVLGSKPAHR
jgi:hypothetical protein